VRPGRLVATLLCFACAVVPQAGEASGLTQLDQGVGRVSWERASSPVGRNSSAGRGWVRVGGGVGDEREADWRPHCLGAGTLSSRWRYVLEQLLKEGHQPIIRHPRRSSSEGGMGLNWRALIGGGGGDEQPSHGTNVLLLGDSNYRNTVSAFSDLIGVESEDWMAPIGGGTHITSAWTVLGPTRLSRLLVGACELTDAPGSIARRSHGQAPQPSGAGAGRGRCCGGEFLRIGLCGL
jgi:hypothetical protein